MDLRRSTDSFREKKSELFKGEFFRKKSAPHSTKEEVGLNQDINGFYREIKKNQKRTI